MSFREVLDLDVTGALATHTITDEIITDAGTETIGLLHDAFLGGDELTIYTQAGSGGTKLAEGSDYSLSGVNAALSNQVSQSVYSSVTILNATYQTGDLYVSYQVIADLVKASDINLLREQVENGAADAAPIGFIGEFAGAVADLPNGWLQCAGQEVSRTAYADLFAAIGTTWGTGNGTTTFDLPDLRGAFLRGTGTHGTEAMANATAYSGPTVGAFEDDQLQGFNVTAEADRSASLGVSGRVPSGDTSSGVAGISSFSITSFVSDGANGTPRTGDETRPFSAGVVYAIKAQKQIDVTLNPTLGSYVYDTGWVTSVDFTDATETITHNLDAELHELIVKVFVKRDATPLKAVEVLNVSAESTVLAASSQWGAQLLNVDTDSFIFQTGSSGIIYLDATGAVQGLSDGEYRIVVYKPNLISPAYNQSLVSWKFDSGWISNSDWSDMTVDIEHGLGAPLSELIVQFYYGPNASDTAAYDIKSLTWDNVTAVERDYGYQFEYVDDNTIRLQTGGTGLVYMTAAGIINAYTTQSGYYKVIVYKPELLSSYKAQPYFSYDLSAANKSHLLPSDYPLYEDLTIEWSGGDGTYTLSIDPVTAQTIDGSGAGVWEGEGEGKITLMRISSTAWKVKNYIDSGQFTNGNFQKTADGQLRMDHSVASIDVSTASGQIFRSAAQTWTFPLTVNGIETVQVNGQIDSIWGGVDTAPTTTSLTYRLYAQVSRTGRTSLLFAIGRWKA